MKMDSGWGGGRRVSLGGLLLGIVLVLPSLRAGFFSDDYLQIAQLEGWSQSPAGPLDLYSFVPRDAALVERMRDAGVVPYFTAPGMKLAFLRPLSSGLMWLDHALFGRWPVGYHVDSLLWYAAMLATAVALLQRAATGSLATLALLIFCVDDAHATAVAFIAARNASVACALAWLAMIAHLRWRTEAWRPGAVLAPACAALGLAGGEMGLGALAYLVAWELSERRPRRARALAPTVLLVAVYLVVYRVTNSGAHGSDTYLDPFGDPLGFVRQVPGRFLLLLGNLLVATPIDFVLFDERLRVPLTAIGGAAGLVVAIWLPRALRRMPPGDAHVVRWMGLGAVGALVVSLPALPGERVLMAAGLGGAVVTAALVRDAWWLLRGRHAGQARQHRHARLNRLLAGLALIVFGLPNLALAAVALPTKTIFFGSMFNEYRRLAGAAEIAAPVPVRVVVVALDDLVAIDLPAIRSFEQRRPSAALRVIGAPGNEHLYRPLPDRIGYRGTTVLSMSAANHRLRRIADDTFQLFTPEGTLLDGPWARTLRARSLPLARGTVIRLSYMTATVLEDRAGVPTRVAFRFDRPVDDPSLLFLIPARGELRRLVMPPIGTEISIPRRPPYGTPRTAEDEDNHDHDHAL